MIDFIMERGIAKISLNHPPANIINFEMMAELSKTLDKVSDASFLVLSSSLPHFSTGVDVRIHTPELAPEMLKQFHSIIRKLHDFSGISICVLNGYALGGGLELALVCDMILAEKDAKLGFPEIRLACFPPVASILLPRLIGRRAHALLITGDTISALEAKESGLVDIIFDNPETLDALLKKVSSYSHDALKSLKTTFRKAWNTDFNAALVKAEKSYLDLLSSPDPAEGIEAFLQKRTPKYRSS